MISIIFEFNFDDLSFGGVTSNAKKLIAAKTEQDQKPGLLSNMLKNKIKAGIENKINTLTTKPM